VSEKVKRETWLDWLPPGAPEPRLFTREELAAELAQRGVKATVADLRHWERVGALPHPVRRGHRGATRAVYPEWFVPLVIRLRILQESDNVPLSRIGPALRVYARIVLADNLSMEEVPFNIVSPTKHDPFKAMSGALRDFVAWIENTRTTSAPVHEALVIFRDAEGRFIFDPATGLPLRITIEAGTVQEHNPSER